MYRSCTSILALLCSMLSVSFASLTDPRTTGKSGLRVLRVPPGRNNESRSRTALHASFGICSIVWPGFRGQRKLDLGLMSCSDGCRVGVSQKKECGFRWRRVWVVTFFVGQKMGLDGAEEAGGLSANQTAKQKTDKWDFPAENG